MPSSAPLLAAVLLTFLLTQQGVLGQVVGAPVTPGCETLPPVECEARKARCAPAMALMKGGGGPVGAVFTCATTVGIPKTQITPFIGPAFASGHPENIVDMITNDTSLILGLRRCMLMSAGLLGLNDTINREALVGKAQASLSWNPPLAAIFADAARTCPQPPALKYNLFLTCIQQRCIKSLSVAAFSYVSPEDKKKKKGGKCKKKKKC